MAEFVMLIAGDPGEMAKRSAEEMSQEGQTVGEWWGKHAAAGRIIEGRRLQPAGKAVRVNGKGSPTVTDGPFAEAKELVGGYGVIQAANIDEAVELVKTWPGLAATIVVRPVWEM